MRCLFFDDDKMKLHQQSPFWDGYITLTVRERELICRSMSQISLSQIDENVREY